MKEVLKRLHRMLVARGPALLFTVSLGAALQIHPAGATADEACTVTRQADPVREVISCGEGLVFERETTAQITVFDRAGDAPPRAIEIEGGAILIDVVPGAQPTQIRTPHAIAAVRGTTYVVQVSATGTSVFVIEGTVEVRKRDDDAQLVQLGAGQGVEVSADEPLDVTQWEPARAARLLTRFGR